MGTTALLELLDIETLDVDLFRGTAPDTDIQRVFGGHVAAQALVAAVRTVDPARAIHSLHAYFLRPGRPQHPIIYSTDRIRDGRAFSTRRVVATQGGKAIFHLSASFQQPEDGPDHALDMPEVPRPEDLVSLPDQLSALGVDYRPPFVGWRSLDMRYVRLLNEVAADKDDHIQLWFRATDALPQEPFVHACALTYMSDVSLLGASITKHGFFPGGPLPIRLASLDHAMWFHRPFRADEWLLYDMRSPSASTGRGLSQGEIFSADGRLVATVVQEGLTRLDDH